MPKTGTSIVLGRLAFYGMDRAEALEKDGPTKDRVAPCHWKTQTAGARL
jgi:hypothetical protein